MVWYSFTTTYILKLEISVNVISLIEKLAWEGFLCESTSIIYTEIKGGRHREAQRIGDAYLCVYLCITTAPVLHIFLIEPHIPQVETPLNNCSKGF